MAILGWQMHASAAWSPDGDILGAKSAVTTFTDHCGLSDPSYTAH